MYWIEQLERLIQRTLTDDPDVRAYVQLRCYPGELAEMRDPEYPLICFKILPETNDLGYITGTINFWVWCADSDPRLFDIFERVKLLFHRERLVFEDSEYERMKVVFMVGEPKRSVQPDFGVHVLNATLSFKGIKV